MTEELVSQRIEVARMIGEFLEGRISLRQALERLSDLSRISDLSLHGVEMALKHIDLAESKKTPDIRWATAEKDRLRKMREYLQKGKSGEKDKFAMGMRLIKVPSRRRFVVGAITSWVFVLCYFGAAIWAIFFWDGPEWVRALIGFIVVTGSGPSIKDFFRSYESTVKEIEKSNESIKEGTTIRRESFLWDRYESDRSQVSRQ